MLLSKRLVPSRLLFLLFLLVFLLLDFIAKGPVRETLAPDVTSLKLFERVPKVPEDYKTVVFYTKYFHSTWRHGDRTDLESRGCPETRCHFTNDRNLAADADAVVFHGDDFRRKDVPPMRRPEQRYVWLTQEAPLRPLKDFGSKGFFNWSFTYHRESDLFLPYGFLVPLREEQELTYIRHPTLDKGSALYKQYLVDLKNSSLIEEFSKEKSSFLSRQEILAYMSSRCRSWSGREPYIKELGTYLSIGTYGKCGTLYCPGSDGGKDCFANILAKNYKFYLGYENQICSDYFTEKVWNPLLFGLVPVVVGGAKYSDFLPPNSYIDATHLSPEKLAEVLRSLSSSPQEYAKYHLWRKYWRVVVSKSYCELCYKLHNDQNASTIDDTQSWWMGVNKCKKE